MRCSHQYLQSRFSLVSRYPHKHSVFFYLFAALCFFSFSTAVNAQKKSTFLNLILTSNLEGRFEWDTASRGDREDPLLLLAGTIQNDLLKRKTDLYLDLGNAFYPGALSRYSYGSVMMDYFTFAGARATLLSSQDIRIGLDNLEFLQRGKSTLLLSANIHKNKNPIFTPYFTQEKNNQKIAFVGLSSSQALLDLAERKVFELRLEEASLALEPLFDKLEKEGVTGIILLSGLSPYLNVQLLRKFPRINLILAGGDGQGQVFEERTERITLTDGRSILFLAQGAGYYRLRLNLEQWTIDQYAFYGLEQLKSEGLALSEGFEDFKDRLDIWKNKFKEAQEEILVSETPLNWELNVPKLGWLLRHYFKVDVAVVQKTAMLSQTSSGSLRKNDLLNMLQDEHSLLTFQVTGLEIKRLAASLGESWVVSGVSLGKIRGYLIEDGRLYRMASTQAGFEAIRKILGQELEYKNSWKTLYDLVLTDIKRERVLLQNNEDFLGNRFLSRLDLYVSFFYNYSNVEKGPNIPTPAGQRTLSYTQWGYEARAVWEVHNQWHQFLLTPYVRFAEEEDEAGARKYIYNLFRGTLVYNLNLESLVKPYHKSQLDTALKEVEGLRPTMLRETIGAFITTSMVTGSVGVGFEKPLKDPEEKPRYGLEALLKLNWNILEYLSLQSSIDLFLSRNEAENFTHLRSEIQNALLFKLGTDFTFTFRHKWYYFYSGKFDERYSFTQFVTSLDWRTDWRLF